jgi:transposase-like protein
VKPVAGPVVQIDEGRIQTHLDEVVRSTVEETLNALLDAEADQLCGARKYERTEGRKELEAAITALDKPPAG